MLLVRPLLKSLRHGWLCTLFHTLQYKAPCILYYIAKVSDGLICQPGTKILHLSCTNADVLSCLSTKTKTFYLGFANFTSTFWGQNLDKIAFELLNSSNLTKKLLNTSAAILWLNYLNLKISLNWVVRQRNSLRL